jgi:aryl-alcohol dehydrogenase-like predicted oxidoreductase
LPPKLDQLKENSAKAAAIAKGLQQDLPTLAIRFAASNSAISTILIGTVEPQHLRVAVRAVEAGPLPEDTLNQLQQLAIDDPQLVDPAQWPPLT